MRRVLIVLTLMLAFTAVRAIAAEEVKLGSSLLSDQFGEAVRSSKYLDQDGIKVVTIRLKTGEEVLDAVLKGSIDVGLIPLTALSKRKFDDQPQLYSVFTRPFLFTSSTEVIDFEGTPLGAAVLADIARTGIIPLSFWNRGISQIWARKPVNSADHFAGLSIAADGDENESQVLVTSLGAQPRRVSPSQAMTAFRNGSVQATVLGPSSARTSDFNTDFAFPVYATEVLPNVGVFASSPAYWSKLSEAARLTWKKAIGEASNRSEDAIRAFDRDSQKKATVSSVKPPDREEVIKTLTLSEVYLQGNKSIMTSDFVPNLRRDLELIDEAREFLRINGDSIKKKSEIIEDRSHATQGGKLRLAFVTDRDKQDSSDWKSSFGDKTLASRTLRCGGVRASVYDGREVGQTYDERMISIDLNAIVTSKDSCVQFIDDKATGRDIVVLDRNNIIGDDHKLTPNATSADQKTPFGTLSTFGNAGNAGNAGNILVLLHGYDNTFPDAIKRAVAFAEDIDFNGLLLVWSWPSTGWKYAYRHDVAASDYSSVNFSSFFQQLILKDPSLRIDYISHSMGGRILLKYLFDIRGKPSDAYATFAAPDIDSDQFRNQASAARVPLLTLYASAYDAALMASRLYNAAPSPRAGAGGKDIIVLHGMDSIDVNLGGHSYLFDHPSLLQDFHSLVASHTAAQRRGLTPRMRGADTYYVIDP